MSDLAEKFIANLKLNGSPDGKVLVCNLDIVVAMLRDVAVAAHNEGVLAATDALAVHVVTHEGLDEVRRLLSGAQARNAEMLGRAR